MAFGEKRIRLTEPIPLKHKFAERDFSVGEAVVMYGVTVGKAVRPIPQGSRISRENVEHQSEPYQIGRRKHDWVPPDTSRFAGRTFDGFVRADGKVGTRNYWVVIPLVFCENRNLEVMRAAMLEPLGFRSERDFALDVQKMVERYRSGASETEILETDIQLDAAKQDDAKLFKNVDGIKFLTHEGGCGGTRQDSDALCRLLAGYILNPNVAGATVLSLGCQHAQASLLQEAIEQFGPGHGKPIYYLEQQKSKSERDFLAEAVKKTFIGLTIANRAMREPVPLGKLVVGLECGGSDGFSGISANPALGYASDLLAALGGTTILSEFPELNGVEQNLIDRCVTEEAAQKFANLMDVYARRAHEAGSGFDMNPSPGNIRDGLITDAMKSAGAAKKGGTSPVTAVLDYTEQVTEPGLNLLCTPGNDVESTTAEVGSGANLVVFTTGLGTPTGNPIAPVLKVATNSGLANRMRDIIDLDAGTVIAGDETIEQVGERMLELIIEIASGRVRTQSERLGQDDFIPWKRGVSL